MAAERHPMLGSVPGKAAVSAKTTTTKSSNAPKGSRAFNAAFRAARKAGRDEFSFGGKRFNTKLAPTTTKTVTTKAVAAKPASQVTLNRQGKLNTAMGRNAAGARVPATGDVEGRAKTRTFFDRAPATPEARERARKALDRGGDFKARSEATFRRSLGEGIAAAVGGPALGLLGKGLTAARALRGAATVAPKTAAATKVVSTATKSAPAATKTPLNTSAGTAAKMKAALVERRAAAAAPTPRPTQAIPTRDAPTLSTRARLNTSTAAPRPANTTPNIRNLPARTPEVTKTTRLEGTKTVTRGGERAVPKAEMKAALKAEKVADKAALAGSGKSPAEIVAAARSRGMMPAKSVAKANVVTKLAEVTPGTSTRAALRSGTAGPAPGAPAAAVRSGAASEAAAKRAADAALARTNAEASRRASVQSTWTRRQAERSRAEVNSYKGPDAKAEAPTKRTRAPNKPKVDAAPAVKQTTRAKLTVNRPAQGALNL